MPTNELTPGRRRAVKIAVIVTMVLFLASLLARAIDIYQTHQSISIVSIASFAFGVLGVVMIAGSFFYTVSRR